MINLAIDASNLREGGGVTYLSQLLGAADPDEVGIGRVTVWACRATAARLPSKPWLIKRSPAWTDSGQIGRMLGQQILLGQEMSSHGCDVLFCPGGIVPFHADVPVVTMSQNMLPFEPEEALRFGRWSPMRLKMWMLRHIQGRSFRTADGLIFLTEYAKSGVTRLLGTPKGLQTLIPHGIEPRFAATPKLQRSVSDHSIAQPITFLYVSILMPYKHQIQVAQAACMLRQEGLPIRVIFIGADWGAYGRKFRELLRQLDPKEEFLSWPGSRPFNTLHAEYQSADAFIFASSCENLPNILIEAMAAGLPIACSKMGPMPEVLGNAGVYFNPLQLHDVADAMRKLITSADLRTHIATQAQEMSLAYSWHRCSRDTLSFIAAVAKQRQLR